MSRTLPTECAHGYISDWGDFGCENCTYGEPCPDGPHSLPERCPDGCNDDISAPPLTEAAEAIARLAEIVKDLEAKIERVRRIAEADRLGLSAYGISRNDIFAALGVSA